MLWTLGILEMRWCNHNRLGNFNLWADGYYTVQNVNCLSIVKPFRDTLFLNVCLLWAMAVSNEER